MCLNITSSTTNSTRTAFFRMEQYRNFVGQGVPIRAHYLNRSVPESPAESRQQLSRYSNQTTDSTTNESQIHSRQGQFFFSPKHPDRHYGPPLVGLFPGDKAAEAAADHSNSFNAELIPQLPIRLHDMALKILHPSSFFTDQKAVLWKAFLCFQ